MFNKNAIGILGIAAAMLHQDLLNIDKPYIIERYPEVGNNRSHKSFSKNTASRIVRKSIPREGPKIGRNEPCSCGSEKKYKNCCLPTDKNQKWLL